MEKNHKNVFALGADNGFLLGLVLVMIFASMVLDEYHKFFSLLLMVLVLAVPVICYLILSRSNRRQPEGMEFVALWTEGIVMFACGSAIMAVVAYVFMRFIDPEYIPRQVDNFLKVYDNLETEQSKELVDMLKSMKEQNFYPSAKIIAVQLVLSGTFTGSILSMAMALLVKCKK